MLINQSFEIDSCDDVELNIKRTSKLEYRISYDSFYNRRLWSVNTIFHVIN